MHSNRFLKLEIKYINVAFIAKNKPNLVQAFLCEVCYEELKRKNISKEDLGKIRTI